MSKRATKRTPEVIDRIIDGLSDGVPLRELCRQDGMPAWRTVYSWIADDPELAAHIARARETGFDAIAESVFEIIDDCPPLSEHVQRAKMRAEYRLKLLAKWSPNRYGDKQQLAHTGADGGAVQIEHRTATPEQMAELTKALLGNPSGK